MPYLSLSSLVRFFILFLNFNEHEREVVLAQEWSKFCYKKKSKNNIQLQVFHGLSLIRNKYSWVTTAIIILQASKNDIRELNARDPYNLNKVTFFNNFIIQSFVITNSWILIVCDNLWNLLICNNSWNFIILPNFQSLTQLLTKLEDAPGFILTDLFSGIFILSGFARYIVVKLFSSSNYLLSKLVNHARCYKWNTRLLSSHDEV